MGSFSCARFGAVRVRDEDGQRDERRMTPPGQQAAERRRFFILQISPVRQSMKNMRSVFNFTKRTLLEKHLILDAMAKLERNRKASNIRCKYITLDACI